jgi:hypothetical protein
MENITNNLSIQCQEDAKNLTEHRTKYESKAVLGPDGFMHEIKNDSMKNEWIDIGKTKRMLHKCPTCGRIVFMYPSVYKKQIGKKCKKCTLTGRNKSEKMRKASSESKKGKNNYFYGMIGDKNPARNPETRKKLKEYQNRPEIKEKKRKLYVERMNVIAYKGGQFFNKNACKFMDEWGPKNGFSFQHAMNGGEFYVEGYWVDGYDKKQNVVFEYDEKKHHFYNIKNMKRTEKDLIRMKRIQTSLKCKFIRYNESLNKIEIYEYNQPAG